MGAAVGSLEHQQMPSDGGRGLRVPAVLSREHGYCGRHEASIASIDPDVFLQQMIWILGKSFKPDLQNLL